MVDFRDDDPDFQEIIRLRRSVDELSILNELAREIGASLDFHEIMETVIRRSCRAVRAAQATITMVDREDFLPAGTLVRDIERDSPDFHLTQNLVGLMAGLKKPALFNNPKGDDRLRYIPLQEGIRNLACVPLLVGNELVGILAAYNKREGEDFDNDDKRVLSIIGAQSAQILERARLFEVEKANILMGEEIRMASSIQMSLLPGEVPDVPGYQLFGMTRPAREVGGDYFDYIELPSGKMGVALGDVSGKGVPASLLMANLQATLRSQALQESSCSDCVTLCSRLLFRSTSCEKFATLFYCTLDPVSHEIAFCNAGHEHPIVLGADGSTRTLSSGGPPAGVLDEYKYLGGVEVLQPGEVLITYSDGVTDMLNDLYEPYGPERLLACVENGRNGPAEQIARDLVSCVQAHAGTVPPMDDVTVVVIKRLLQ